MSSAHGDRRWVGSGRVKIAHPLYAIERAADNGGTSVVDDYSWTIRVPLGPPDDEQVVADRIRRAWYDAHYYGRPSRDEERSLAFLRFVATADEEEGKAVLARVIRDELQRRGATHGRNV